MNITLQTTDYQVLFTQQEIILALDNLATTLNKDYAGQEVVLICTLYGAKRFADEMLKRITFKTIYDEIRIATYKGAVSSAADQGIITHIKELTVSLLGKHVLVFEDTVDTGFSAIYLKYNLGLHNPLSLKICTFIDKPDGRKPWIKLTPDYCCFTLKGNPIIAGFGLDFADSFRERDDVIILRQAFCDQRQKKL